MRGEWKTEMSVSQRKESVFVCLFFQGFWFCFRRVFKGVSFGQFNTFPGFSHIKDN